MEHLQQAKNEGNEAFRTGKLNDALDHYMRALSLVDNVSSDAQTDPNNINTYTASIWNNLAAVYTRQGKWEDCITAASNALTQDSTLVKALFRRATALSKLGRYSDALKDASTAAQQNPSNSAARKLADDIIAKLREESTHTISERSNQLKNFLSSCTQNNTASERSKSLHSIIALVNDTSYAELFCEIPQKEELLRLTDVLPATSHGRLWEQLLAVSSKTRDQIIQLFVQSNVQTTLTESLKVSHVSAEFCAIMLNVFAQASRKSKGSSSEALHVATAENLHQIINSLAQHANIFLQDIQTVTCRAAASSAVALLGIQGDMWDTLGTTSVVRSVVRLFRLPTLHCEPEEAHTHEQIHSAAAAFIAAYFRHLYDPRKPGATGHVLRSKFLQIVRPALDSLGGQFWGSAQLEEQKFMEDSKKSTSQSSNTQSSNSDLPSSLHLTNCIDPHEALVAVSTCDTLFLVYAEAASELAQRPTIRRLLLAILQSSDTEAQARCCELYASLSADEQGRSALDESVYTTLARLADSETLSISSAATATLARASSAEYARAPGVAGLSSMNSNTAHDNDGKSSADRFHDAAKEKQKQSDAVMTSVYYSLARLMQQAVHNLESITSFESTAMSSYTISQRSAGMSIARSIDGLSSIAARTPVKQLLIQDEVTINNLLSIMHVTSGDVQKAVTASGSSQSISSVIQNSPARDASEKKQEQLLHLCGGLPTLLGAAFILYAITTSVQRQREEQLAEMDVDATQWEELRRLTMSTEAVENEKDPPDQVLERVTVLVEKGFVRVIAGINATLRRETHRTGTIKSETDAESSFSLRKRKQTNHDKARGAAVREMLSLSMLNMVEPQPTDARRRRLRGLCVQQGGLNVLLDLCDRTFNTEKGSLAACQALAKICISTNPNLFSVAQQSDLVPPLLRLCSDSQRQLHMFEGCMALTNLASLGNEVEKTILINHGLSKLETCQFEDHTLVRRAATQCIANLAGTPQGRHHIGAVRPELWVALCKSFADDIETSRAAAAAVAMATAGTAETFKASSTMEDPTDVASVNSIDSSSTPSSTPLANTLAPHEVTQRLVDKGIVRALVHAMLSGDTAIVHRAVAALRNIVEIPEGRESVKNAQTIDPSLFEDEEQPDDQTSSTVDSIELSAGALCALIASNHPLPKYFNSEDTNNDTLSPAVRSLATEIVERLSQDE